MEGSYILQGLQPIPRFKIERTLQSGLGHFYAKCLSGIAVRSACSPLIRGPRPFTILLSWRFVVTHFCRRRPEASCFIFATKIGHLLNVFDFVPMLHVGV